MSASSWLMGRLTSAGGIEGVESVAAEVAVAYELEPEAVLSVVRRDFISAY